MNQEINFLIGIPKEKEKLSVKKMAYIVVGCILFLLLVSLMFFIYIYHLSEEEKKTISQKIEAKTTNQLAYEKYPLLADSEPLAKRVIDLRMKLVKKQVVFDNLIQETSRLGFSNYLQSLSEIIPERVWLTHILMDQRTNNASIRGFALAPKSVPVFLKGLQNTNIFHQFAFGLFFMQKLPEKDTIQFEIANNIFCNKTNEVNKIFLCENPKESKK